MIGRFVISKAGHDKDKVYVVVAEEGEYLYLSDGRLKISAAPKKKKRKHVQLTNRFVGEDLLSLLENRDANVDNEIRYAIKQYLAQKE